MTTPGFSFDVIKTSQKHKGRAGLLTTPHGVIETPVFMPVGTQAAVKAVLGDQLLAEGTQIMLANTYHLLLRPGPDVVEAMGGLHQFMNWDRPILTDSGGFQIFSLGPLTKLTEKGVVFKSHLDGDLIEMTPESTIRVQQQFGADIMMPLDECLPSGVSKEVTAASIERTFAWEARCKKYFDQNPGKHKQELFGIVQGGMYPELRRKSAEQICSLDFFGYAIGGLSVGEGKEDMYPLVETTTEFLPKDRPRYLMGVGVPDDIDAAIESGIDMFDCVFPTRVARHGTVFSGEGSFNIKRKEFERDPNPIEIGCQCYTCRNYSRAYLRHLWRAKEYNALSLLSIHNIHFLIKFVGIKRQAILAE
jgi:queuine tRNA-ribosyltransferase